jgi:hypothetical protein
MTGGVLLEGEEGEPVGVIEVALPAREEEEQERADHEQQAHEDLERQDLHRGLRGWSASVVARIVVTELTGMRTAQTRGESRPAYASATASTL